MFSMQILHLKNVFLKINLEDCKITFEDFFWRSTLCFSLKMALHVFFSILKINFKDHYLQIFKKNLQFFFFIFFFSKFFFTFSKSSEWIFKMILEKKFGISEIWTWDPWQVLHSATLLPGLLWKKGKRSKYVIICVFWWWL